jgi:nitroreductase
MKMKANYNHNSDVTFDKVVSNRRSVRSFKRDIEVDDQQLEHIIRICDMAPSSGGLQTFEIYRVKSKNLKKKLANAAHDQMYVAEAPLLLVFCANPLRSVDTFGERKYLFALQDATIAAAYAQLAACSLSLSSVWIGSFDEDRVSEIIGLPKGYRPVAILLIGYASEKPQEKITRGSADLLRIID